MDNKEQLFNYCNDDKINVPVMEKINNHGMYGDHVNVGTPGHIDHGGPRRSAILRDEAPEDVEYAMDNWKKSPPAMWYSDQAKLGGKKRDKAKWKAAKKARKANRGK
jgi:hypothetical protein